jgi:4-hydroxy-2-oxoheptanedioate aldolase
MREHAVRAAWRRGEPAFGAWLSIPSSFSAEVAAHAGFDWVCIDMQHGVIDCAEAVHMLQAISLTPAPPVVRVPWNEPGIIGKVLDAGAMGIIIPMVNSPAEARAAVSACRYAPDGARSYGPTRAPLYAGADYYRHANAEVVCIPMIETKGALDRIDDILSVPGIDAVYVGPADMSITLGLPPAMDNGGAFEDARIAIAEACARHDVIAGIYGNAALAAKHVAAGYRLITVHSDIAAIATGAAADLATARDGAARP